MQFTFPYLDQHVYIDPQDPSKGTTVRKVPWIPARIFTGKVLSRSFDFLVDSGADEATFRAYLAAEAGITDYTTGAQKTTVGIGNSVSWMHSDIGLLLKDPAGKDRLAIRLEQVGFDPNLRIAGLLGRASFFDAFRVTFDHPAQEIHLKLLPTAKVIDEKEIPIYKPPLPANKRSRGQNR